MNEFYTIYPELGTISEHSSNMKPASDEDMGKYYEGVYKKVISN